MVKRKYPVRRQQIAVSRELSMTVDDNDHQDDTLNTIVEYN